MNPSTTTFAHIADLQLGFRKFNGAYNPQREQDFYDAWLNACYVINDENVEFVLIVGDVFDEPHPPVAALNVFAQGLRELTQNGRTKVIVVDGNHERPKSAAQAHPLDLFRSFENVWIVNRDEPVVVQMASGLSICAVPYRYDKELSIEDLREADICAVHAGCTALPAYMQSGYVWNTEWDRHYGYVALGDWHAPLVTGESSRYAGALERVSFGDAQTETGFWLVDVSSVSDARQKDNYTCVYVESTARDMHDIALRYDDSAPGGLDAQLRERLDSVVGGAQALTRVTITNAEPVVLKGLKRDYPFAKLVFRSTPLSNDVGISELTATTTERLWDEFCEKTTQPTTVHRLGAELLGDQQ